MSDTPRTDAVERAHGLAWFGLYDEVGRYLDGMVKFREKAKELERDLATANAKNAILSLSAQLAEKGAENDRIKLDRDAVERDLHKAEDECERLRRDLAALQAKPDVAGLVERKVPESLTYAHLTDKQMADKVRMLLRSDLDFEPVCSGGRDRIMFLSGYCDRQARALLSLSAQLQEKEAECNAKTEVLLEAQRIAAQAQAECEGLRQDAAFCMVF